MFCRSQAHFIGSFFVILMSSHFLINSSTNNVIICPWIHFSFSSTDFGLRSKTSQSRKTIFVTSFINYNWISFTDSNLRETSMNIRLDFWFRSKAMFIKNFWLTTSLFLFLGFKYLFLLSSPFIDVETDIVWGTCIILIVSFFPHCNASCKRYSHRRPMHWSMRKQWEERDPNNEEGDRFIALFKPLTLYVLQENWF